MEHPQRAALVRLGDTDLMVADPAEDIRGRTVLDRHGEDIGEVEGLLLDDQDAKVRFLSVASGGFLGIGEQKVLIPVETITRIDADRVHIDKTREHVAGAPAYDPSLAREPDYFDSYYGYYGYAPYWAAGYRYPAYPHYPMH